MNSYGYIGYPHKESEYNIGFISVLPCRIAAYPKETIDVFRTFIGPEILWFANIIQHIILILNISLYYIRT